MFFLPPVRGTFIFLVCFVCSSNLLASLSPIPEEGTPEERPLSQILTRVGLDPGLLDDERCVNFPELLQPHLQDWGKTYRDINILDYIHQHPDWQHECCVLKVTTLLVDAAFFKELEVKENKVYLHVTWRKTKTKLEVPEDWKTNRGFLKTFLRKMILFCDSIREDDKSYGLFGLGFYQAPIQKPLSCESPY